jgi:hypothetical protein
MYFFVWLLFWAEVAVNAWQDLATLVATLGQSNLACSAGGEAGTVTRFFYTFPAEVAGKFEKIGPLQKILFKATFQTPFVQ